MLVRRPAPGPHSARSQRLSLPGLSDRHLGRRADKRGALRRSALAVPCAPAECAPLCRLRGRFREIPGMPVEVAGGVRPAIGDVLRRMLDVGARGLRPRVMTVNVLEINEHAGGCPSGLTRAEHTMTCGALA